MPATRDLDPTASPGHFFGAEVRRARLAVGWTLADLAATVPCDASTVSRIEAGTLSPGERFAAACDEAFPQMGGWFGRFYHDSRTWVGPLAGLRWRKSTYSGSNGGGCIEVGGHSRHVLVRDTQDRTGPALRFSSAAWRRFTDQIKRG